MKTSLRNRSLGFAALVTLSALSGAQMSGPMGPGQQPRPILLTPRTPHDWVHARVADYRVVSISSGLRDYRQKFNQVGRVIHPGFKTDRLAVVEIEVRNTLDHSAFPPVFMAALTDSDGVRGIDSIIDTRQQAFPTEYPDQDRRGRFGPAEIGAGQVMKLALVFSISAKAKPTALEFAPQNFRDMPFGRPGPGGPGVPGGPGRPGGPGPGADGAPPERRFGPRPTAAPAPPRDAEHVYFDLSKF